MLSLLVTRTLVLVVDHFQALNELRCGAVVPISLNRNSQQLIPPCNCLAGYLPVRSFVPGHARRSADGVSGERLERMPCASQTSRAPQAGPWRGVARRAVAGRNGSFGLAPAPGAWPGRPDGRFCWSLDARCRPRRPVCHGYLCGTALALDTGDDVNLTSLLALHSPVCQLARAHSEVSPRYKATHPYRQCPVGLVLGRAGLASAHCS